MASSRRASFKQDVDFIQYQGKEDEGYISVTPKEGKITVSYGLHAKLELYITAAGISFDFRSTRKINGMTNV
jgi:hypothetical protein